MDTTYRHLFSRTSLISGFALLPRTFARAIPVQVMTAHRSLNSVNGVLLLDPTEKNAFCLTLDQQVFEVSSKTL